MEITDENKSTVSGLRQRVMNIKEVSNGRITLYALIELSFDLPQLREALDKALDIIEN